MESSLRPSASVSSRISAIDVGQLDKINAIPNKSTNNVLMDGLCLEDQLYLNALMDDESSGSDLDSNLDNPSSPWSPPMAERPMTLNMNPSHKRRLKMKMKPQYAITMSLEDISYIRPSWGMSKGIKKVEPAKHRAKKVGGGGGGGLKVDELEVSEEAETRAEGAQKKKKKRLVNAYHLFLALIMLFLLALMLMSYLIDLGRHKESAHRYRIELRPSERRFSVFKQRDGVLLRDRSLKVNYGRGIPSNLKHEDCTCQMFEAERRKHLGLAPNATNGTPADLGDEHDDYAGGQLGRQNCFACFDWAQRANMQMFVNRSHYSNLMNHHHAGMLEEDLAITCYDIRWQSYDTLATPLVDCFEMGDEQWFGLGDTQAPVWPLNKFEQLEFKPLASNLSVDFHDHQLQQQQLQLQPAALLQLAPLLPERPGALSFGSQVDFSLLSSNGFSIGNLRTDLQPAIKISASKREICLSAGCSDKCSQLWPRRDRQAERLRQRNNLLEYSICSASSWRLLSLRLIDERTQRLATQMAANNRASGLVATAAAAAAAGQGDSQQAAKVNVKQTTSATGEVEREGTRAAGTSHLSLQAGGGGGSIAQSGQPPPPPPPPPGQQQQQPQATTMAGRSGARETLGLIERTIFTTSPEFIANLDGQTLRLHVDKIVKLNLKTSPILLIDTRWQNYLGSFKLNAALFPKAKLLFEILHNKGFKIVLTVKPHIDINVGIAALKQLLDQRRLVSVHYESELQAATAASSVGRLENMISVAPNHFYLARPGTQTFERQTAPPPDPPPESDHFGQQQQLQNLTTTVVRRKSFFRFTNETVYFKDELEQRLAPARRKAYIFDCKESYSNQCVLIDLAKAANRAWMVELIKRSSFLSQEADAVLLAGAHPEPGQWDAHFRQAMGELVDELFHKERLFVLPKWSNNFNFVHLAPRRRDWDGLRSVVDSVLNLGMQGFALIHPGSVWGDLRPGGGVAVDSADSATAAAGGSAASAAAAVAAAATAPSSATASASSPAIGTGGNLAQVAASAAALALAGGRRPALAEEAQLTAEGQASEQQRAEELAVRWLQVAVFLPILQFNDLAPLDQFNLHEQLQSLVRIRKLFVVPEIKRHLPFTPLVHRDFGEFKAQRPAYQQQLAALRYAWNNNVPLPTNNQSGAASSAGQLTNEAVGQQFMIGADLLVAPVLVEGQRQRDIYLPAGIWHDELRQLDVRGGKWLRNYPIELNEVAWFTRAKR